MSNHVRAIADSYAAKKGIKLNHDVKSSILPENSAKIAQAFHSMPHEPNHPAVKAAYSALIGETSDQLQHLKDNGYRFSEIQPGQPNPYPNGSKDVHHDISNNKHLWYFPTDQGFGSDDSLKGHPLLEPTNHTNNGKRLLANDAFRIVHDVFGHGISGSSFGPKGEEQAWTHHMQMFSPLAQKALTTETRGQNSWVNFGPHAEHNRKDPKNTIYAPQKAGLLPDWALTPNTSPERLGKGTEKNDTHIDLIHYSTAPDLKNISPDYQGSADTAGAEKKRIENSRGDLEWKGYPNTPVNFTHAYKAGEGEAEAIFIGKPRYHIKANKQKIYDLATDPAGIINETRKEHAGAYSPGQSTMHHSDLVFNKLKQKGYIGWHDSRKNVVGLFNDVPVDQNHTGGDLSATKIEPRMDTKLDLAKADLIPGGLADQKDISDFPKKLINQGRKVEMEHTNNPKVASEIAADHLTEDPNYYSKLASIEKNTKEKVPNTGKTPTKKSILSILSDLKKNNSQIVKPKEPRVGMGIGIGLSSTHQRQENANLSKASDSSISPLAKSTITEQISTVALVHNGNVLMGTRRDNGKWTNPGGKLNPNETPRDGAIRELLEEAGIKSNRIVYLGSKEKIGTDGQKRNIHCFREDLKDKPAVNLASDPDKEFKQMYWVSVKNPPEKVMNNLHSPDNALLEFLGMIKKK